MPHRAVEQMPVISLRALLLRNRAGTRNATWRGGDRGPCRGYCRPRNGKAIAKRRGRPMPMTEARPTNTPPASSEPIPKQTRLPGGPTRQRQIGLAAAALTKGQVNAVRAAFKAGVTPSRIARQFGLSHSDVRKALSSDEPSR